MVKVKRRRSKRNHVKLDGVVHKIVKLIFKKTKLKTPKPNLKKAMVHQQNPKQSPLDFKITTKPRISKRSLNNSLFHHSFFEALEIIVPKVEGSLRAQFWSMLWKNKKDKVEVFMHVKKDSLPSLLCNRGILGEEDNHWTESATRSKFIEEVISCLLDCLPRHPSILDQKIFSRLNGGGI